MNHELLSQLNEAELSHVYFHRFTRESFRRDVKMFSEACRELGKEIVGKMLNVKPDDVEGLSDLKLIKAHKWYWDQL